MGQHSVVSDASVAPRTARSINLVIAPSISAARRHAPKRVVLAVLLAASQPIGRTAIASDTVGPHEVGTWRQTQGTSRLTVRIHHDGARYILETAKRGRSAQSQPVGRWTGRSGWHFEARGPAAVSVIVRPTGELVWRNEKGRITIKPSVVLQQPKPVAARGAAGFRGARANTAKITARPRPLDERFGLDLPQRAEPPAIPRLARVDPKRHVTAPLAIERQEAYPLVSKTSDQNLASSDAAEMPETAKEEPPRTTRSRSRYRATQRARRLAEKRRRKANSLAASFQRGD